MQLGNTTERYGWMASLLHWLMSLLLIVMVCVGLYMTDLPKGPDKMQIYSIHKAVGILILMLVVVRVIWRGINTSPKLSGRLPALQRLIAVLVYIAFYIFMFAIPLSGWMMSNAFGYPVSFFGLFDMPTLLSKSDSTAECLAEVHEILAYCLIGAFVLHVLGALYHQFILKDNILARMMPWKKLK